MLAQVFTSLFVSHKSPHFSQNISFYRSKSSFYQKTSLLIINIKKICWNNNLINRNLIVISHTRGRANLDVKIFKLVLVWTDFSLSKNSNTARWDTKLYVETFTTTRGTFTVNIIYLWLTKSSLKHIVKLVKSSPNVCIQSLSKHICSNILFAQMYCPQVKNVYFMNGAARTIDF